MRNEHENFSRWSLTSMTGSGHVRRGNADVTAEVYVKSVNHRSMECKFRLGKELLVFELDLAAYVAREIERGRVDVQISLEYASSAYDLSFDEPRALALLRTLSSLQEQLPALVQPISIKDILHLPGIIKDHAEPTVTDTIKAVVIDALGAALVDLRESRVREGSLLERSIKDMLASCSASIHTIVALAADDVKHQFARYKQRVAELFSEHSISEDRLYQELALLAERADFTEEVDRLKAHVEHFDGICQHNGAKGRKLDFLCQEMLRESNTLLSKACSHDVIKQAIDLKAHVERIREQVQNIE